MRNVVPATAALASGALLMAAPTVAGSLVGLGLFAVGDVLTVKALSGWVSAA